MSSRAALFGRPQQAQARHLLQFKAGKMAINEENMVRADPRKGWAYVYQAGDGKLHFCWIDRETCLVEDNFVINSKQAEFKCVPQCTTGRVFMLSFTGSKRFFIWMQEPNKCNDNAICSKINEFIKSSPSAQSATTGDWFGLGELNSLSQRDLWTFLTMDELGLSSESDVSSAHATSVTIGRHLNTGHLEDSVTNSSLRTANPAVTAASSDPLISRTASSEKRSGGKIQLQDLRNILSSLSSSLPTPVKHSTDPRIELTDVLNFENLRPLLEDPEVQKRLLPHLPPTDPDMVPSSDLENLTTNIHSSQFKSTLKSFSNAFQTGKLAPVLAQFNLGGKADEAARRGDLVEFSQALQGSSADVKESTSELPDSKETQPANRDSKLTEEQTPNTERTKKSDPTNSKMDVDE